MILLEGIVVVSRMDFAKDVLIFLEMLK